jgi:large subunit ribosomal protein L5
MLRLQEKYKKQIILAMREKFGYKNDLAVPKIEKVVVNTGIGRALKDEKAQGEITKDLTLITGQKPTQKQAKKAIAAFKTRRGMVVGLAVTLRGKRMYDFLGRLIDIAIPRSRDFRGLKELSIDKEGNLNIGIKEQIIFPEISAESAKNIFGLEICVKTTAKRKEEGVELLRLMGFPIKK